MQKRSVSKVARPVPPILCERVEVTTLRTDLGFAHSGAEGTIKRIPVTLPLLRCLRGPDAVPVRVIKL